MPDQAVASSNTTCPGLLVEMRGVALWLTVDQPAKRNALSFHIAERLAAEVRGAAERGAKAIVITGGGNRAFVSGLDLSEIEDALSTPAGAKRLDARSTELYRSIAETPLPVIARVNGHAIGAGLLLALACDWIVASDHIKVGLPAGKIGLMLSPEELVLVRSAIPLQASKRLLMTAAILSAVEAKQLGMLDTLVDEHELDATLARQIVDIASLAPIAISSAKRLLNLELTYTAAVASDVVDDAYERVYSSSDLREGISAVQQKRAPMFSGK